MGSCWMLIDMHISDCMSVDPNEHCLLFLCSVEEDLYLLTPTHTPCNAIVMLFPFALNGY